MNLLTTIFIAVGLSMDAFAVAIASGVSVRELKFKNALQIAIAFGGFQFLMPVIGWFAGVGFREYISNFDHWIAFLLLVFIGSKMIYESRRLKDDRNKSDPTRFVTLFVLAIATSIDALAVGLGLSLIKVNIITPSIIIGMTTFSFSIAGVYIGKKLGHFFEDYIELAGGIILIGIGLKILLEHLLI